MPQKVRAKFKVSERSTRLRWDGKPGEIGTVKMSPVTSGSEENKSFYEATPGGSLELSTVNQEALEFFKLGKEFYLDFTPASEG